MSKQGIVNIRGKEYQTVALRVHTFREMHPDWRLVTSIVHRDETCVVMEARIFDPQDRLIANGHAEEYRADGQINATSALENAETSAIGRALAALGLGGTEFASADEVARAVNGDKPTAPTISGPAIAFNSLQPEVQDRLRKIVPLIIECESGSRMLDLIASQEINNDEKAGLWYLLDSKTRSTIKKAQQEAA